MAKRDWLKTLGWNEEHTDEIRHVAYAYIRQGKYDIALPLFEALVVLDPNSVYDLQILGAIYVQTDQPKKAIKVLDQALQIDADHGPTLLNLMKAFFMAGRIEDGRRLAKILQLDKDPHISGTAAALMMCYPS
jgi:tetratricopeptide (TPR) repeat protein